MEKLENKYQKEMWTLQQQIYNCPCLRKGNESCYNGLQDRQFGPDAIYVGEYYGKIKNHPKILFIGNNPNSSETDFGIKMNTVKYMTQNPKVRPYDFYHTFYNGWKSTEMDLTGIKGFDHKPKINQVLENIFTGFKENIDLVKTIALTNSVLCKGTGKDGAPAGNMRRNCTSHQFWLKQTLQLLQPDTIFIFSGETWDDFIEEKIGNSKEIYLTPAVSYAYKLAWPNKSRSLVLRIPHFSRFVKNTTEYKELVRNYEKIKPNLPISEYILNEIQELAKQELVKMGFNC